MNTLDNIDLDAPFEVFVDFGFGCGPETLPSLSLYKPASNVMTPVTLQKGYEMGDHAEIRLANENFLGFGPEVRHFWIAQPTEAWPEPFDFHMDHDTHVVASAPPSEGARPVLRVENSHEPQYFVVTRRGFIYVLHYLPLIPVLQPKPVPRVRTTRGKGRRIRGGLKPQYRVKPLGETVRQKPQLVAGENKPVPLMDIWFGRPDLRKLRFPDFPDSCRHYLDSLEPHTRGQKWPRRTVYRQPFPKTKIGRFDFSDLLYTPTLYRDLGSSQVKFSGPSARYTPNLRGALAMKPSLQVLLVPPKNFASLPFIHEDFKNNFIMVPGIDFDDEELDAPVIPNQRPVGVATVIRQVTETMITPPPGMPVATPSAWSMLPSELRFVMASQVVITFLTLIASIVSIVKAGDGVALSAAISTLLLQITSLIGVIWLVLSYTLGIPSPKDFFLDLAAATKEMILNLILTLRCRFRPNGDIETPTLEDLATDTSGNWMPFIKIGTIALSFISSIICGVLAANSDTKEGTKNFDFLSNASKHLVNAVGLSKTLFGEDLSLIELISQAFGKASSSDAHKIRLLVDECATLLAMPMRVLKTTNGACERLKEMPAEMSKLMETVKGNRKDLHAIRGLSALLVTMHGSVLSRIAEVVMLEGCTTRPDPIPVLLSGPRAIGKTHFVGLLAERIRKIMDYKSQDMYQLNRSPDAKYFNTYLGQEISYVDEFLFDPEKDAVLAAFNNIFATLPYIIQGASLSEKKQDFSSRIVFMTTNVTDKTIALGKKPAQNANAIWSRIIWVKVSDPIVEGHNNPRFAKFDHRQEDCSHLDLEILPHKGVNEFDTPEPVSVEELITELAQELAKREIEFIDRLVKKYPDMNPMDLKDYEERKLFLQNISLVTPNSGRDFCVMRFQGLGGTGKTTKINSLSARLSTILNYPVLNVSDFSSRPDSTRPYIYKIDDVLIETGPHANIREFVNWVNSTHGKSVFFIGTNIIHRPQTSIKERLIDNLLDTRFIPYSRRTFRSTTIGVAMAPKTDYYNLPSDIYPGALRRLGLPGLHYHQGQYETIDCRYAACVTLNCGEVTLDGKISNSEKVDQIVFDKIQKFVHNGDGDVVVASEPPVARYDYTLTATDAPSVFNALSSFPNMIKAYSGRDPDVKFKVDGDVQALAGKVDLSHFVCQIDGDTTDPTTILRSLLARIVRLQTGATIAVELATGFRAYLVNNLIYVPTHALEAVQISDPVADSDIITLSIGTQTQILSKKSVLKILAKDGETAYPLVTVEAILASTSPGGILKPTWRSALAAQYVQLIEEHNTAEFQETVTGSFLWPIVASICGIATLIGGGYAIYKLCSSGEDNGILKFPDTQSFTKWAEGILWENPCYKMPKYDVDKIPVFIDEDGVFDASSYRIWLQDFINLNNFKENRPNAKHSKSSRAARRLTDEEYSRYIKFLEEFDPETREGFEYARDHRDDPVICRIMNWDVVPNRKGSRTHKKNRKWRRMTDEEYQKYREQLERIERNPKEAHEYARANPSRGVFAAHGWDWSEADQDSSWRANNKEPSLNGAHKMGEGMYESTPPISFDTGMHKLTSNALTYTAPVHSNSDLIMNFAKSLYRNVVKVKTIGGAAHGMAFKGRFIATVAHLIPLKMEDQPVQVQFDHPNATADNPKVITTSARVVALYRIRDLAILEIIDKSIPAFKDITNKLTTWQDLDSVRMGAFVQYYDTGVKVVTGAIRAIEKRMKNYTNKNMNFFQEENICIFMATGYESPNEFIRPGDCGLPLIGLVNNEPKWLGYHDAFGTDRIVFSYMIAEDIELLNHHVIPNSDPEDFLVETTIFDEKVYITPQISDLLATLGPDGFEQDNIICLGGASGLQDSVASKEHKIALGDNGLNAKIATSFAPTRADQVKDVSELYFNKKKRRHCIAFSQLRKYGQVNPQDINQECYSRAEEYLVWYYKTHYGELPILSRDQVTNGIRNPRHRFYRYSKSLDMKTSPGAIFGKVFKDRCKGDAFKDNNPDGQQPFYVPDTSKPSGRYLEETLENYWKAMGEGKICLSGAKACLKQEILPLEKCENGGTRLFQACDTDRILLRGRLTRSLMYATFEKRRTSAAKGGANIYKEATEFRRYMEEVDGEDIFGDFKRFDKSIPMCIAISSAFNRYECLPKVQQTEENLNRIIADQVSQIWSLQLCDGSFFVVNRGNLSGQSDTLTFNDYVNHFCFVYAYFRRNFDLGRKLDEIDNLEVEASYRLCTCGDDNWARFAKFLKIGFETVQAYFAELGMLLTPADKGLGGDDATFCSRSMAEDPATGLVFPCLKKTSIERQLHYTVDLTVDQLVENFKCVLLEAALWDEAYYNSIKDDVVQQCKNLNKKFGDLGTRVQRMIKFKPYQLVRTQWERYIRGTEDYPEITRLDATTENNITDFVDTATLVEVVTNSQEKYKPPHKRRNRKSTITPNMSQVFPWPDIVPIKTESPTVVADVVLEVPADATAPGVYSTGGLRANYNQIGGGLGPVIQADPDPAQLFPQLRSVPNFVRPSYHHYLEFGTAAFKGPEVKISAKVYAIQPARFVSGNFTATLEAIKLRFNQYFGSIPNTFRRELWNLEYYVEDWTDTTSGFMVVKDVTHRMSGTPVPINGSFNDQSEPQLKLQHRNMLQSRTEIDLATASCPKSEIVPNGVRFHQPEIWREDDVQYSRPHTDADFEVSEYIFQRQARDPTLIAEDYERLIDLNYEIPVNSVARARYFREQGLEHRDGQIVGPFVFPRPEEEEDIEDRYYDDAFEIERENNAPFEMEEEYWEDWQEEAYIPIRNGVDHPNPALNDAEPWDNWGEIDLENPGPLHPNSDTRYFEDLLDAGENVFVNFSGYGTTAPVWAHQHDDEKEVIVQNILEEVFPYPVAKKIATTYTQLNQAELGQDLAFLSESLNPDIQLSSGNRYDPRRGLFPRLDEVANHIRMQSLIDSHYDGRRVIVLPNSNRNVPTDLAKAKQLFQEYKEKADAAHEVYERFKEGIGYVDHHIYFHEHPDQPDAPPRTGDVAYAREHRSLLVQLYGPVPPFTTFKQVDEAFFGLVQPHVRLSIVAFWRTNVFARRQVDNLYKAIMAIPKQDHDEFIVHLPTMIGSLDRAYEMENPGPIIPNMDAEGGTKSMQPVIPATEHEAASGLLPMRGDMPASSTVAGQITMPNTPNVRASRDMPAQQPLMSMVGGPPNHFADFNMYRDDLLNLVYRQFDLSTTTIQGNSPKGTIVLRFPYGIRLLNPYAQNWAYLHKRYNGRIRLTFSLSAVPMLRGNLLVGVVRNMPAATVTTYNTSQLMKINWAIINLDGSGEYSFEIGDARQTKFFRDTSEDPRDTDPTDLTDRPGIIAVVYTPLVNQFGADSDPSVVVNVRSAAISPLEDPDHGFQCFEPLDVTVQTRALSDVPQSILVRDILPYTKGRSLFLDGTKERIVDYRNLFQLANNHGEAFGVVAPRPGGGGLPPLDECAPTWLNTATNTPIAGFAFTINDMDPHYLKWNPGAGGFTSLPNFDDTFIVRGELLEENPDNPYLGYTFGAIEIRNSGLVAYTTRNGSSPPQVHRNVEITQIYISNYKRGRIITLVGIAAGLPANTELAAVVPDRNNAFQVETNPWVVRTESNVTEHTLPQGYYNVVVASDGQQRFLNPIPTQPCLLPDNGFSAYLLNLRDRLYGPNSGIVADLVDSRNSDTIGFLFSLGDQICIRTEVPSLGSHYRVRVDLDNLALANIRPGPQQPESHAARFLQSLAPATESVSREDLLQILEKRMESLLASKVSPIVPNAALAFMAAGAASGIGTGLTSWLSQKNSFKNSMALQDDWQNNNLRNQLAIMEKKNSLEQFNRGVVNLVGQPGAIQHLAARGQPSGPTPIEPTSHPNGYCNPYCNSGYHYHPPPSIGGTGNAPAQAYDASRGFVPTPGTSSSSI